MPVKRILQQQQFLIPLKIISVYLVWKLFHRIVSAPDTWQHHYWEIFCAATGHGYALLTGWLLQVAGLQNKVSGIDILMTESNRMVMVQEHCLAIPAMVVFTGSIVFFNGSFRSKLRFITAGILGIVLINVLRLAFVCWAWVYLSASFFNLHHSLIYTTITYGFIFLMIKYWIDRQSGHNTTATR